MRANFGLNLAAWNGIDTEIGGILNSDYLASDFWLCQELRKSLSPFMDGSVIFLSVTSQVYLPSDSCRSADFQLSLTSLSELSQHSLLVREKILRDNIQPSDIATLVTETLKAGKYSTQLMPGLSGD